MKDLRGWLFSRSDDIDDGPLSPNAKVISAICRILSFIVLQQLLKMK
jgi:hypothetical protein